jgi:hypothetical protein
MANKQDIQKVLGVTAAAFAQLGQVSEEEALAMSGLDAEAFKEVRAKVNKAASEVKAEPTTKVDHFYDIVAKAAAEYMDGIRK